MQQKREKMYDIWGDNVNMKDLVLAMSLCVIGSLGGYIIAPNESPMPLVFGLVGGIIGFGISAIVIKPKREIHVTQGGDNK